MSPRIYSSSRDRILDAAESALLAGGVGGATVESVLRASGISKGGFFHHFASKDALLAALLERLSARVAVSLENAASRDPVAQGRTFRAQIALAFDMPKAQSERLRALVLALIESAKTSTTIAASARASTKEWIACGIAEGLPLGNAVLVQLALDGYWLGTSMGTLALTSGERRALVESLRTLTLPVHDKSARKTPTRRRRVGAAK